MSNITTTTPKVDPNAKLVNKDNASTLLNAMKPQFEAALGKLIGADRFARMALTAVGKNPRLLECTGTTVLASLMDCAQLGLIPNSPLKQASLVPYKNRNGGYDCQLIIEYGGYCSLAYRTGDVDAIAADVVYDCDQFKFQRGTTEYLQHIPELNRPKTAKKTSVYAYIKNKNGGTLFTVMSIDEVFEIRNRSQNYKASKQFNFKTPWDTDEDEMCKKTAVRRVMKLANLSAEYMEAISKDGDNDYIDNEREARIPNTVINATVKPDISTVSPQESAEDAEYKEESTSTLTVLDISERSGEKNGKKWTRFTIKLSDGNEYGTFDTKLADKARDIKDEGLHCRIESTPSERGNGFNLVSIESVITDSTPAPAPAEMSDAEQKAQEEFDLQFSR